MAADYLISSLQPLAFDAPAPCTREQFLEACRGQIGERHAMAIAALMDGRAERSMPTAAAWSDIDAQMRNAAAAERARARGEDPAKWRRPADGCSLFWAGRVQAAFQERDPAKRDRLLDQARWDAAGELVPPAAPLSVAAAYAYGIRLAIAIRRQKLSSDAGNALFDALASASEVAL